MPVTTRFVFPDALVPVVTQPAMTIGGKSVRDFELHELKALITALRGFNEDYLKDWDEDYKIGEKPAPEVITLLKKEITRREDAEIDREIEEAQRIVDANKTQEMRYAEAQAKLDAAKAKKAQRTAA